MTVPDLDRLRRFALMMGLLLLTWSLAGIALQPELGVTPFGVPFRIARPELLPTGLALAAVYGTARYYYYAMMLGTSPYRLRRDILDDLRLNVPSRRSGKTVRSYWGPVEFTTSPWTSDHGEAEKQALSLREAFPKFARARVRATVKGEHSVDPEGNEYVSWAVDATIPIRCRLAALFQDLDYAAPVWFNGIAWATFLWQALP